MSCDLQIDMNPADPSESSSFLLVSEWGRNQIFEIVDTTAELLHMRDPAGAMFEICRQCYETKHKVFRCERLNDDAGESDRYSCPGCFETFRDADAAAVQPH